MISLKISIRSMMRAARRALRSRFLVLLTLREGETQEHIDDETETLRQVISEQHS